MSAVFAIFSKDSVTEEVVFGKIFVPRLLSGEVCVGAQYEFVCSSCAGGSAPNIMVSPLTGERAVAESVITVITAGVGIATGSYKQ